MFRNKYLAIFLLIAVVLISCEDKNSVESSEVSADMDIVSQIIQSASTPEYIDGRITVQAYTKIGGIVSNYDITGACFANGVIDYSNQLSAGTMLASDATLTENQFPNNIANYGYYMNQCDNSQFYPVFGDTTDWGWTGSQNVTGFTTQMYVKPEIEIYTPDVSFDIPQSKSAGIPITWNGTSATNKIGLLIETNPVQTLLYYGKDIPKTYYWEVDIDDDGSYTIPAQSLSNFPDSCIIDISIARMNSQYEEINSKTYVFEAISFSQASYYLVP